MTAIKQADMGSVSVLTADARLIMHLLNSGSLDTVSLVTTYLRQIARHDDYLHAMLSMPSREILFDQAIKLDEERRGGKLRGPLHGLPIIVKDNIATLPSLGMSSAAGSLALFNSRPRANAGVIDRLLCAGAIILGKTNMSEFSNFKSLGNINGWSAIRGQTQSAYVRGGQQPDDGTDGHSNTSGSSSGSAVGVSAGYAPVSLGTDTDGSLVYPASRAALYTIKSTHGLVPQNGLIITSPKFDAAGPLTKTVYDLALVLDVIANRPEGDDTEPYVASLQGEWRDLVIGTLDPEIWKMPEGFTRPVEEATQQINREIRNAYARIKTPANEYVDEIDVIPWDKFEFDGEDSELQVLKADFKPTLNLYLGELEYSQVRNLEELIEFNLEHEAAELPPGDSDCGNRDKYDATWRHLRACAVQKGLEKVFDKYRLDCLIGPAESLLSAYAASGGYPIASMPLGYLAFNGRPFNLAVVARRHHDKTLLKVLRAWETTFDQRQPPPMFVGRSEDILFDSKQTTPTAQIDAIRIESLI